MPKLNLAEITPRIGSDYPAPFNKPCQTRQGLDLSDAGGLSQYGAIARKTNWSSLSQATRPFMKAARASNSPPEMSQPILWATKLATT